MATTFTDVGEFRKGKGSKKSRLGPRVNIRTTDQGKGKKPTRTPNEVAISKLLSLLDKQGGSIQRRRFDYVAFLRDAEQIRFMNMSVLAAVLQYMYSVNNDVTEENFSYAIIRPYIDRLLPRQKIEEYGTRELLEDELEIIRLKMAATFLRYINYVLFVLERISNELSQAQQLVEPRLAEEI